MILEDRLTLPNLSDAENDTLNSLLHQLVMKQDRNLLRASYYDGKRAASSHGGVIPPQFYKMGMVLGWSAKAVDMLARRCNPDGVVWPDGELNDLGFAEFNEANQLVAQIKAALVSSLIHGVSFLVNTQGDTEAGEPQSLFHVKDALNATGDWNPRRRRLDNLLSVTARNDKGEPTGLVLYLDGVTINAEKDVNTWSVDRSEHIWGVPAEPLVYKPFIGKPFGVSRISRPLMSIHERALRAVVRTEGHMDVYSIPQLILLGADSSMFKNADGSMKPSWQIALGRVLALPDDSERDDNLARTEVKSIQAASPDPHLAILKQLAAEFSGEASIPLNSLGMSDQANPTSADSYLASREDLISEAEGATDDWSGPLRRAIARGLAIQNGSEVLPKLSTLEMKWRSPVHLSRAAQADAGAKQLASVPWLAETEVGLELLGLDEQQIRRAMAEKRRVAGRALIQALAGPVVEPAVEAVPDVVGG